MTSTEIRLARLAEEGWTYSPVLYLYLHFPQRKVMSDLFAEEADDAAFFEALRAPPAPSLQFFYRTPPSPYMREDVTQKFTSIKKEEDEKATTGVLNESLSN